MLFRIKKPSDINEWPYWFPWMNCLDNLLINLNDYKVYENMYNKRYIVVDGMTVNTNWLEPLHSVPKKVEINIRG